MNQDTFNPYLPAQQTLHQSTQPLQNQFHEETAIANERYFDQIAVFQAQSQTTEETEQ